MIEINQIKLPADHTEEELIKAIVKALALKSQKELLEYRILRRSLDSRKKPDIFYVYHIVARVKDEAWSLKRGKDCSLYNEHEFVFPRVSAPDKKVVIVGMGPCGLFAGLMLAGAGFKPLILERGKCVEERTKSVNEFWEKGILDEESNVSFGEGGAGTFSDGKLNTMIKDKEGFIRFVLKTFVEYGADEEIMYSYKPHIGTDVLSKVIKNIREDIKRLGGTVRFNTKVTSFIVKNDKICGVMTSEGEEIPCDDVILAIGHSSRDTFRYLSDKVLMSSKPFAVGVRVIHPQSIIDENAYGQVSQGMAKKLGAAPYKLTYNTASGRGVYSFCMCPGGVVVNASSQKGMLAINGMSYHDRASGFANSGIIVSVGPEDYEDRGVLSGMYFQEELERKTFELCGGKIPVCYLEDFLLKREGKVDRCFDNAIKGSYSGADVYGLLPEFVSSTIAEGMNAFGRKIKGFDRGDTLILASETRTSSPVRIVRGEDYQSLSIKGLYPCGEGAGYAGGITSACVDGIKVALAICGPDMIK